MSRVMLCHGQAAEERALLAEDLSVVCCDDSEDMLAEVALHHPDVVVYEVRPDSAADLAVLRLLRRVAPEVPLVLVGSGAQASWPVPDELAPRFLTPLPVQARRLRSTVRRALHHGAPLTH